MTQRFVKHLLAFVLLATMAAAVHADFTTTGKLVRVGTGWASEGFYLTLDVATANNNCKTKSILFIDRSHPQYRETVSIALLSLAQARPIDVYHNGSCSGGAVTLTAVSIHTAP